MNNVTDLRIRIEVSYSEEGVAFDDFESLRQSLEGFVWVGSWKHGEGDEDFVSVIHLLRDVDDEGV